MRWRDRWQGAVELASWLAPVAVLVLVVAICCAGALTSTYALGRMR